MAQVWAPFRGEGAFYKGNLHTHTTRSDGPFSLETTVRHYLARGYDFMAITDHRKYYDGGDVDGMVLLPGMECDFSLRMPDGLHRTHHVVALGTEKVTLAHDQDFVLQPVADVQQAQAALDKITAAGMMALYAHPRWSHTTFEEYGTLMGLTAMEVFNSGCHYENDTGIATSAWHEMLMKGRHLWAVASDDAHELESMGHGWVQVFAREKSRQAIMESIAAGRFYASTGPAIHDISLEGNRLTVACSPCAVIQVITDRIGGKGLRCVEGDKLTQGVFTLREDASFARVQLLTQDNRFAWSQPVYLNR